MLLVDMCIGLFLPERPFTDLLRISWDISSASKAHPNCCLLEVIDADGSGTLRVSELVQGRGMGKLAHAGGAQPGSFLKAFRGFTGIQVLEEKFLSCF